MTTNGLTLTKHLVDLQRAGLNALNVSLDTLQESTYGNITRRDGRLLKRVLAGIDLALQLGFSPVKVCLWTIYYMCIRLSLLWPLKRPNPFRSRTAHQATKNIETACFNIPKNKSIGVLSRYYLQLVLNYFILLKFTFTYI